MCTRVFEVLHIYLGVDVALRCGAAAAASDWNVHLASWLELYVSSELGARSSEIENFRMRANVY